MAGVIAASGKLRPLALNSDGSMRSLPTRVFAANDAIANLPAGASVVMVFDLGVDWDQYTWISVCVHSSVNGLSSISAHGSDDGVNNNGLLVVSTGAEFWVSSVTAGSAMARLARPRGRYIRLSVSAVGTGAQGAASRVHVTAYPN